MITYVISNNDSGIEKVLKLIDTDYQPVSYVNNTLPNKLFSIIDHRKYKFCENDQFMSQFNYLKLNNVDELYDFIVKKQAGLEQRTSKEFVVIEDFRQLVNSSNNIYGDLNFKIIEILIGLKRYESFIIDTQQNKFVSYYIDHLEVVD
ncbi:hypothetical protein CLIB1444_08S02058 [[Candida] jaroonii]|uniref:Uncharacterized protein n=1 Tax=[Candida] jaroonii TaxID=467808 RepID=A0ACA9YB57_9ASCO|nr:hypothetical protein CLIB1444_08S02058 [[Candida] jaroonii]